MTSGRLWKKALAMLIKQKDITCSSGLPESRKTQKSEGILWESMAACLPSSHTGELGNCCWSLMESKQGGCLDTHIRTLQQGNHRSNAYRAYLNYRAQPHPSFLYSCKLKKCDVVLQAGNWGTDQFYKVSKTPQEFWGHHLSHSAEVRARSKFF